MSRRVAALVPLLVVLLAPRVSVGQSLRDKLPLLFSFGNCGQPLCLDGSVNAANGHGEHFIPAAASGNAALLNFISDAVALSVAHIPLAAAASGVTFRFENGLPVRTSGSAGPVFGERSQTLGRGRAFVGMNINSIKFRSLRGVPLSSLAFTFTHQNVGSPTLGDPVLENDVIEVHTALDLGLVVTNLFLTYGVFDRVDVGVAVPLVYASLQGRSTGQINPFGSTAVHFFSGSATDPVLRATSFVEGSAFGVGDVATRLKVRLSETPNRGLALIGDIRFPTGREEDLLGSGEISARGLAVVSGQFGEFSPHLNAGFLYRGGDRQNNALLVALGFDHLVAPWVTFAADILAERQVGDNKLTLPGEVDIQAPFFRAVQPTNIPERRDDLLDMSIGFKFAVGSGLTAVTNTLFPIGGGGLRPDAAWTVGLEYNF
jgi:hypothetical protein